MNEPTYTRWRLAQLRAILVGLRIALRALPHVCLGNRVVYQGRTWLAANGVCSASWELLSLPDKSERVRAPTNQIRRVRSLREYWHSVHSRWRWWYTSWFQIETGKQLGLPYAFYGTEGARKRRQKRFDRRYLRRHAS